MTEQATLDRTLPDLCERAKRSRVYVCSVCGRISKKQLWRWGGRYYCGACLARESARVLYGREVVSG